MSTLLVNIDDKKSEKIILAVVEALGLNYELNPINLKDSKKPLNKSEQVLFKGLKNSFEEIKLHKEGKIKLKTIEEVIAELS